MKVGDFRTLANEAFDQLIEAAQRGDGLSFIFAILGIDSGAEDAARLCRG